MLSKKPPKLVAVALANKLARIAWALMANGGALSKLRHPALRNVESNSREASGMEDLTEDYGQTVRNRIGRIIRWTSASSTPVELAPIHAFLKARDVLKSLHEYRHTSAPDRIAYTSVRFCLHLPGRPHTSTWIRQG